MKGRCHHAPPGPKRDVTFGPMNPSPLARAHATTAAKRASTRILGRSPRAHLRICAEVEKSCTASRARKEGPISEAASMSARLRAVRGVRGRMWGYCTAPPHVPLGGGGLRCQIHPVFSRLIPWVDFRRENPPPIPPTGRHTRLARRPTVAPELATFSLQRPKRAASGGAASGGQRPKRAASEAGSVRSGQRPKRQRPAGSVRRAASDEGGSVRRAASEAGWGSTGGPVGASSTLDPVHKLSSGSAPAVQVHFLHSA